MPSRSQRTLAQLAPCLGVQLAQLQEVRVRALEARLAFDESADALSESERLLAQCSDAVTTRLEEPRALAAQEVLWWRAAFADALRAVDASRQRLQEKEAELEDARSALGAAAGKARQLQGLVSAARRRAAAEAEVRSLSAVEHIRPVSEMQR